MGFLDHQGESEFPFAKETVFNAMLKAIPTVKGMKVDNADKLQGRIVVKAGVSLMSWGENIRSLNDRSCGKQNASKNNFFTENRCL